MRDLGVDIEAIAPWFADEHQSPYVLVRVPDEHAAAWADVLGVPVRRCYIDDALLDKRAADTRRPKSELVAAKLPDRGSTMAGDFGEILVFLYHAAVEPGVDLIGPKKWRLKQDRKKPAPYSDVVHFVLPNWPKSSADDRILCSEVKTKSRGDDYYISLVGELFDRLHEPYINSVDWSRLGNAITQAGGVGVAQAPAYRGILGPEAAVLAAAAFYFGGYSASAYLTLKAADPDALGEIQRACYELLSRPSTIKSARVRALVGAVRRGNLEPIRAQSEQAAELEAAALQR